MDRIQMNEPKKRRPRLKLVAVAAIVAALLCGCVLAVTSRRLTPAEVAWSPWNTVMADAFESEIVFNVNETKKVGDYSVTLMSVVSGRDLPASGYIDLADAGHNIYMVLCAERVDGKELVTPDGEWLLDAGIVTMVEGYAPWVLSNATLGGGKQGFEHEGRIYYLCHIDELEVFADSTAYVAFYIKDAEDEVWDKANPRRFCFDEYTGEITVRKGQDVAMFTLPLDPDRADPERAAEILKDIPEFAWEWNYRERSITPEKDNSGG